MSDEKNVNFLTLYAKRYRKKIKNNVECDLIDFDKKISEF